MFKGMTVIYLVGWMIIAIYRHEELFCLKLNELGDFLAGSFGPLAFAWLVLGYLQQGRELKLSSEALQLQAQELKASVEQQGSMVAVSRQQLEEDIRRWAQTRADLEFAARPKLHLVPLDRVYPPGAGMHFMQFRLSNTGREVDQVKINARRADDPAGDGLWVLFGDRIPAEFSGEINVPDGLFVADATTEVFCSYTKSNGTRETTIFLIHYTVGGNREYRVEPIVHTDGQ
jgi:hypothetical protein